MSRDAYEALWRERAVWQSNFKRRVDGVEWCHSSPSTGVSGMSCFRRRSLTGSEGGAMKKTPYQEVVVSVRDASGRDVDAITCQVSAWAALSLKTGSSCSLACFADELPKKGRFGASAAAAAARLLSWPSSWRRASPAEALPKKLIFDGAAGASAAAASLADEPPPKKDSLDGAAGSASFELPKNESFDGAGSSAPKARRGSRGHHGLRTVVRGMLGEWSALRFDGCRVGWRFWGSGCARETPFCQSASGAAGAACKTSWGKRCCPESSAPGARVARVVRAGWQRGSCLLVSYKTASHARLVPAFSKAAPPYRALIARRSSTQPWISSRP